MNTMHISLPNTLSAFFRPMRCWMLLCAMLSATVGVWAYDFSSTASTGQTLYFTKTSSSTAKLVAPSDYSWSGYTKPSGAITLPSEVQGYSVTAIDRMTFAECTELTSVVIPGSVQSIGLRAFAMCSGLTEAVLQEGVQDIGMMAFMSCSQLSDISLPTTISRIAASAFEGTAYYLDDEHWNEQFTFTLGTWVIRQGDKWQDSVVVEEGIVGLANRSFAQCANVPKVVLPSTLKYIGESAFVLCSTLDTVQLLSAIPPQAADDAFAGLSNLTILVPYDAREAYQSADVWKDLQISTFGNSSPTPWPIDPIHPIWDSIDLPNIPPLVGIDEAEVAALEVLIDGAKLVVRGAKGRGVMVCDAAGHCLVRARVDSDRWQWPLPCDGVYLIVVEGLRARRVVYCQ